LKPGFAVLDSGRGDSNSQARIHEPDQDPDRLGVDHGIGVVDQHIRRCDSLKTEVATAPKADVVGTTDEFHPRVSLLDELRGSVAARVVNEDTLDLPALSRFPQGIECRADVLPGVISHNDDRNGGGRRG
jgi:hypothetical protein